MKDLSIALNNRPGALADMGAALGRAGVSIEGGGAWVVNGQGTAHFLFEDGTSDRSALEAAGIQILDERDVLIQNSINPSPANSANSPAAWLKLASTLKCSTATTATT